MVELLSQPLADIDPEFRAIALETGEWMYGLSGISTREKLLLNLASDVCREHFGLAFRLRVQAALHHVVPFSDVLGGVRCMGPYAGYPAAADALAQLGAIGDELGIDVQAEAAEARGEGGSGVPDARSSRKTPGKVSARPTGGCPASSRPRPTGRERYRVSAPESARIPPRRRTSRSRPWAARFRCTSVWRARPGRALHRSATS